MTLATFKRNPLLRVRLTHPIVCDLLLDGRSFELPSSELLGVLATLTGTATLEDFALRAGDEMAVPSDAEEVLRAFVDAGLLVPADRPFPEMQAVQHWIDRGWLDALIFHLRARSIRFDDDGHPQPDRLHDELLAPYVEELADHPTDSETLTVRLPAARPSSELPPLGEVLYRRRSNRPWTNLDVTLDSLATILDGATSESQRLREQTRREAASHPSVLLNSAFSALEIYVCAFKVVGLDASIYKYDVGTHSLVVHRPSLQRSDVATMCAGQERAGSGAVTFVIAAEWRRYMLRYQHSHAYRVLMINAAELGQKILLLATALGFSTFITPAFREPLVDSVLGFSPDSEAAIEAIGVG